MPTYSEMTITFTNDWVTDDDTLKITTDLFGEEWTWKTVRALAYEVTQGLPTANAGERAAINFEAAFDLDKSTGYVTTVQNQNEVLIQSETDGENFLGIKAGDDNVGTFSVAFNNLVETPTSANVDYALTRSPYYVNIPFNFVETTKATISTYIWDGDLGTVPATATRVLTKIRPSVDYAEFNVDLSKIIRSQFDVKPAINVAASSQIIDSLDTNVKWVKFTASYTDATNTIADIEGTLAAIDGYGYNQEGVNPDPPSTFVLTSCANRKVHRNGFILFPFMNEGTITSIDVDSDGGEINDTLTMTTSDESTDAIQYICVDVPSATTDDYITIKTLPAADEFVYNIIDECKFTPMQVVFLNKYGVYDTITMFKKRTDELTVTNKTFKNNYISGGTYNITNHQVQKTNVVGTDKMTLSSGFINEAENDLYEELHLSERVYFYENSSFVPVNVESKTFKPLTRLNDRLTKYNVDFSYAFNKINNI